MARPSLRPAWLGAAVLIAGCIGLDPAEPEVQVCSPPALDTSQWQVVSGSVYSLKIPRSYERDASTGRWYSGRTWVRPALIEPGDVNTDPLEVLSNYNECRATVGGREMLIQLGTTSVTGQFGSGIYLAGNWGRVTLPGGNAGSGNLATLIVEAWTPTEIAVEEILAMFWTMVVTSAG